MPAAERAERVANDALAWHVYQIEDLLDRAERVATAGMRVLRRAHAKAGDDVFRLRPQRIAILTEAVDELGELAEQARTFTEQLPARDIRVTRQGAATQALRELGEGAIYDCRRVLLVGRMASRAEGLRALARGLRASDAYESWNGLTLKEMLQAFDRMTPQLIRLLVTDARLAPGHDVAQCSPAEVNRLAARIDDYVDRGS